MILIVNYDLKGPKGSYKQLYEALRSEDGWWHYLRSTWLVATNKTPAQLFDELQPYIRPPDRLLISVLSRERRGWLPRKAWSWIRRHNE